MEKHNIPPVFDNDSKVLILGSFPSVKSRQTEFFYGHPQNRFWKVISALCCEECPTTVREKKEMLLKNGIALWDVIASCEIVGSSDSSIKNVTANDISKIIKQCPDIKLYLNGKTAEKYYKKYVFPKTQRNAIVLPSTSAANAAYSVDDLIRAYSILFEST